MRPTFTRLLVVLGLAFLCAAPPVGSAAPLDRKIKKLERELTTLERTFQQAMVSRARYKTLKASIDFWNMLLRRDRALLAKYTRKANVPVTISGLFRSSVARSYAAALMKRSPRAGKRNYLWFKCLFGLSTVQAKTLYTIRIDLVDAHSGNRIFQSFGPYQRRALSRTESFAVPLQKLRVQPGRYRLKAMIQVGSRTATAVASFVVPGN